MKTAFLATFLLGGISLFGQITGSSIDWDSNSGREKVAKQLLEFFATSPLAKGWFAK